MTATGGSNVLTLCPSVGCFQRISRISLVPDQVAGWSVNRLDMLTRHSQQGRELCPLLAGVRARHPSRTSRSFTSMFGKESLASKERQLPPC